MLIQCSIYEEVDACFRLQIPASQFRQKIILEVEVCVFNTMLSVAASATFYTATWRLQYRLNKLITRTGSVLDIEMDDVNVVAERRTLSKLLSTVPPTHSTVCWLDRDRSYMDYS